jgi:hypothetical protein
MTMKPGGPYLISALLCETVIHGQDDVFSIIRVIGRIQATPLGKEIPDLLPPIDFSAKMFVVFVKGDAPTGDHVFEASISMPSGKQGILGRAKVEFKDSTNSSLRLTVNVNIRTEESGIHWITVLLDGEAYTRLPVQIDIVRPTPNSDQETPHGDHQGSPLEEK